MNEQNDQDPSDREQSVQEDFLKQPHLFTMLVENSLTVAESLRDNYYRNTTKFVADLRNNMQKANPVLKTYKVTDTVWSDLQGEVVTFIDGGLGRMQISGQSPILLRVGSYCVRTGERQLSEREQFGYYPIILGDLEGGSKQREDFPDIVRITAELLGGLAALERTPDLRVLMFHGPLVYTVWHYMGHTPFAEKDIDLFLRHYALDPALGQQLKQDFLREAQIDIYPKMTYRSRDWIKQRLFEPLSWMAFLFRRILQKARQRSPMPLIVGVVERGRLREFSEKVLLEEAFRRLRKNKQEDHFNKLFERTDLDAPRTLLDHLNYTDTLLLGMLLEPGQYSEHWEIDKYEGFSRSDVFLPEIGLDRPDYTPLKPGRIGFPRVHAFYLKISDTTEPLRLEVFADLEPDQVAEAARRTYLYSRLLPGYGFPVGLDVTDKFARIPSWLTDAYDKQIRFQLGVSLQSGEISDKEMRRILIYAMYMKQRDWLFRPDSQ